MLLFNFIIICGNENVKVLGDTFVQSTKNGKNRENDLYFLTKKVL